MEWFWVPPSVNPCPTTLCEAAEVCQGLIGATKPSSSSHLQWAKVRLVHLVLEEGTHWYNNFYHTKTFTVVAHPLMVGNTEKKISQEANLFLSRDWLRFTARLNIFG